MTYTHCDMALVKHPDDCAWVLTK